MGKVLVLNRSYAKVSTKVMQEHSVKKHVCRATKKRILTLRRRLSALIDEKGSLEEKNRELIDSVNKEKNRKSELQKQVFYLQRMHHEAIISLNTLKVNGADTLQNITSCLQDINLALPHIMKISDNLCCNKVRLTSQLNLLQTFEAENYLPKAFRESGPMNSDLSNGKEKKRKHEVGPMVKGVLIQKPTIRLERVTPLHQPQSQEPVDWDLSATEENNLTPITEENEQEINLHMGQISMRRQRKLRLGSGERWRMRKQEQLEKEQQKEREQERRNQRSSIAEDSNDSDNLLTPVIDLQRGSGMLFRPHLVQAERGRANEGKEVTSRPSAPETHRLRAGDDPLEGCSWMNINLRHSSNKKGLEKIKTPSPVTSDTSDEESDTLNSVQTNMCSNFQTSLHQNKTFLVYRESSSLSLSGYMSHESSDFSRSEPDSTSNNVFARVSTSRESMDNSSSASSVPSCKQSGYSDNTSGLSWIQQERGNCGSGSLTSSGEATLTGTERVRPSQDLRRSSGTFNNCTPIVTEVQQKRIGKPTIRLYPGEESDNTKTVTRKVNKGKTVKLSAGSKSLGKSVPKKSLELSRGASAPSSAVAGRPSQGRPGGSSQKKKAPKKSASSLPANNQLADSNNTSGISRSQQERGNCGSRSLTSSGEATLTGTERVRPSQDLRQSSGTPIVTLEVQGKRIRKPTIRLYPGEESDNPKTVARKVNTGKTVKLSAGSKSLEKSVPKKSSELSRGASAPSSAVAGRPSQGRRMT